MDGWTQGLFGLPRFAYVWFCFILRSKYGNLVLLLVQRPCPRLHDMPDDAGEPLGSDEGEELIPTAGRDVIKLPAVANLSIER